MLVPFSTKFLFLGLYISVASGSPTIVTLNLLSILEPRNPPDPNPCIGQTTWVSRQCDPERGPGVWFDSCKGEVLGEEHTFKFYGNCNDYEHEVCENILDEQNDKHIECVFFDDLIKRKMKLANGSLVGTSEPKTAAAGLSTTQVMASVNIDDKMGASVSAVLLSKFLLPACKLVLTRCKGEDKSFAIEANNIIVGHVHGTSTTVCKGNKSQPEKARECYPTGRYWLKKGDVIDFTWGMTQLQVGVLAFAIWKTA